MNFILLNVLNSNLIKTVTNTITTDQWGQVNYTTVGTPSGRIIISAVVCDTPSMYCVCASSIRVYKASTTAAEHIPAANTSVKIRVAYI